MLLGERHAGLPLRPSAVGVLWWFLGTAISVVFLSGCDSSPGRIPVQFGSNDFIEYHTAHTIAERGGNPYSAQEMYEAQEALGRKNERPLMMWNPPWTLLLLKPVLLFSFSTATVVWVVVNIVLSLMAAWLLSRERGPFVVALAAILLFYPTWSNFKLGQVGALLLFFTSALYVALSRDRLFLAGVAAAGLTIKPHLFLLLGLALLCWVGRGGRWRVVGGFGMAFLGLVIATAAVYPDLIGAWIEAILSTDANDRLVRVAQWEVATLVGVVRNALAQDGLLPPWPLTLLVPGVSGILLLVYLIRRRSELDWRVALPPLVTASVFVSPFGWVFDQTVAALLQVEILSDAWQSSSYRHRLRVVLMLLVLQGTFLGYRLCCAEYHHQLFWLPGGLLLIWLFELANRDFPVRKACNQL